LAREAGLPLPERDPAEARRAEARATLVEVMEDAVRFYRLQLNSARAAAARAYLDTRGLNQSTRDRFEIGFAPDGWTALLDHMTARGVARERLHEAGLVRPPEDGRGEYDRFRNRIMFPIRDARGRAIAFGGRAIAPDQDPKYLNSPDTPLFDKGRSLYNIGPARTAAGRSGALIVVEGYMDTIALAQAGIDTRSRRSAPPSPRTSSRFSGGSPTSR
jgi:DNA primase